MTTTQQFYLVSRSRHGGATHVQYGEIEKFAYTSRDTPLFAFERLTMKDVEDMCGPDRADWPSEAVALFNEGATEIVEFDNGAGGREFRDSRTFTAEDEIEAYITAIRGIDDGTIRVLLDEQEAAEAVRDGRVDTGYGRQMDTGAALAAYGVTTNG